MHYECAVIIFVNWEAGYYHFLQRVGQLAVTHVYPTVADWNALTQTGKVFLFLYYALSVFHPF
jgi:hypothetical protein